MENQPDDRSNGGTDFVGWEQARDCCSRCREYTLLAGKEVIECTILLWSQFSAFAGQRFSRGSDSNRREGTESRSSAVEAEGEFATLLYNNDSFSKTSICYGSLKTSNKTNARRPKARIKPSFSVEVPHPERLSQGFYKPIAFSQKYKLGRQVGVGQSSRCFLCVSKSTKKIFACKVINLEKLSVRRPNRKLPEFHQEVKTLKMLNHENIVKLRDFYASRSTIFIVLEYVNGGELFERILQFQGLEEEESRLIFSQICSAIEYMHSLNIVHRDIKPENVMLCVENGELRAKIIDFGFSKVMENTFTGSFLGTAGFLAPELLYPNPTYSRKVDVWALGVTLYIMISCFVPFSRDLERKAFQNGSMQNKECISNYDLTFQEGKWEFASDQLKNLLRMMLTVDPLKRPTTTDCLNHLWTKGNKKEFRGNRRNTWSSQLFSMSQNLESSKRVLLKPKSYAHLVRDTEEEEEKISYLLEDSSIRRVRLRSTTDTIFG